VNEAQRRYDICKECDSFQKTVKICKECNCFMPIKVNLALAKCPISKWQPVEVEGEN
jgi:hypothetical protein